ncbi:NAD(P)-dependent oxidoreductase [Acetobacter malorum]|uniref:NAD(P)-dependent oxidoreductase n=1 Tax=Acetobacter malorum TaxID=178901 RepID=UPI0009ED1A73|nr:NAD(P)-binding domain-containing protein [Acetobacter malorum]
MNQSTTVVQSSHDETPAKTDVRTLCVGVIGLGHMGSAFARNLIAHGYRTLVFDRNRSKREACNRAEPVAAIGDLVPCDVVFSSLPNDDVLSALTEGERGLLATLKKGAIHISTSTVSPEIARRLASLHALAGQGYVASPVLEHVH